MSPIDLAVPADGQAPVWRVEDAVPIAEPLGIRTVEITKDVVKFALDYRPDLCNPAGQLHGGAIMTLADTAGGCLSYLNLPPGALGTATIESKTNFLEPVSSGTVTATARALRVGKSIIVVESEVTDESGRLIAKVTQTQTVFMPR